MAVDNIVLAQWARSMHDLLRNPPSKTYMFTAVNEVLEAHGLPVADGIAEHWTNKRD
jgi:hypothetical protein